MFEYHRSIGKIIKTEFEASNIIKHPGRKGSSREYIIRKHLSNLLPSKYGIGYGEIHASDNSKSGENDLIIFDKSFTPLIYQDEATNIFPIECVYGIIEVKSKVEMKHIKAFMDKIRELRYYPRTLSYWQKYRLEKNGLLKDGNVVDGEYAPFGIIIALDGPNLDTVCQGMKDYLVTKKQPIQKYLLNAVCIINKGIVTRINIEDEGKTPIIPLAYFKGEMAFVGFETGEDWFLLLYSILYEILYEINIVQPPNFTKYLPIELIRPKVKGVLVGNIA